MNQMMDVNIVITNLSIIFFKIEITDRTRISIMFDAEFLANGFLSYLVINTCEARPSFIPFCSFTIVFGLLYFFNFKLLANFFTKYII